MKYPSNLFEVKNIPGKCIEITPCEVSIALHAYEPEDRVEMIDGVNTRILKNAHVGSVVTIGYFWQMDEVKKRAGELWKEYFSGKTKQVIARERKTMTWIFHSDNYNLR